MKTDNSGFTLIELMLVIAIIGVMLSIAVPRYGSYTKRAKFSEVIAYTADRKSAVNLCVQETNFLTGCTGDGAASSYYGIPVDITTGVGRYIASITTLDGVIAVIATDELDGVTYTLRPTKAATSVNWVSEGTCEAAGFCKH